MKLRKGDHVWIRAELIEDAFPDGIIHVQVEPSGWPPSVDFILHEHDERIARHPDDILAAAAEIGGKA